MLEMWADLMIHGHWLFFFRHFVFNFWLHENSTHRNCVPKVLIEFEFFCGIGIWNTCTQSRLASQPSQKISHSRNSPSHRLCDVKPRQRECVCYGFHRRKWRGLVYPGSNLPTDVFFSSRNLLLYYWKEQLNCSFPAFMVQIKSLKYLNTCSHWTNRVSESFRKFTFEFCSTQWNIILWNRAESGIRWKKRIRITSLVVKQGQHDDSVKIFSSFPTYANHTAQMRIYTFAMNFLF